MAFSKQKALLRKAVARIAGGLWAAIGRVIDIITPGEGADYLPAAGYELDQIETDPACRCGIGPVIYEGWNAKRHARDGACESTWTLAPSVPVPGPAKYRLCGVGVT